MNAGADLPDRVQVAVVGAGLAGLCAASTLARAGADVMVFEASDGVGGRVRTDSVDGYLLDRGFQVLLTGYPELHRFVDLSRLEMCLFEPGALVWRDGRGHVVSDPLRRPGTALATAAAPIGSVLDKVRILRMRRRLTRASVPDLLRGRDVATSDALRDEGFSTAIIERFFRPLVGGIQLDPGLRTSRRMFDAIFRTLATGDAGVPARGMGALPAAIAATLPAGTVRLGRKVDAVGAGSVRVGDRQIRADAVVVATEGPVASTLTGIAEVPSRAAGCVYFAADSAPVRGKYIVLDGDNSGPVLNAAVMSAVAPSYAPEGKSLIAAALPGVAEGDLDGAARRQLRHWWGPQVDAWRHLATYRIPHGQPGQDPPFSPKKKVHLGDRLFVCGDHRDTGSIQGAMHSGRRCGEAVAASIGLRGAGSVSGG